MEKLLLTVKFDIPGKNVKVVEITEDFVLGKAGPVWHYADERDPREEEEQVSEKDPVTTRSGLKRTASGRKSTPPSLKPIYEDEENDSSVVVVSKRREPSFTEFDEAIFAELETSL